MIILKIAIIPYSSTSLVEFGLAWARLDLGLAPCGFPLDRIRFDLGSLGFGFVLGLLWVGFGWVEFALGWPYHV